MGGGGRGELFVAVRGFVVGRAEGEEEKGRGERAWDSGWSLGSIFCV